MSDPSKSEAKDGPIRQGDGAASFYKKPLDKLVAWLNYIVE